MIKTRILATLALLVSTTLYCPKKSLTYEEAMAKAQEAQDKHAKALASADKHLREANKYRAQARDIKNSMKVRPAQTVTPETIPGEELEMPVTIQPVESITPTEPEYEEPLSVSTPMKARKIRNL